MNGFSLCRRAALAGGLASLGARAAPALGGAPIDVEGGRCLVPVKLDGKQARLVLDTGAERSLLCTRAVARLGSRPDRWVSTTLRGAGGRLEAHANVDVVATLGGMRLWQNAPTVGLSLPVTSADLGDADGLLGGDILCHYAVELDVPRGQVALLPAAAAMVGAARVALQAWRQTMLLAPVMLDGRALVALLDTGAAASLINARGLYRLGLATPDAGGVTLHGIGGATPAGRHLFRELRVGSLRVEAPALLTLASPEAAFDMVLGLDVLGRQRILVSYARLLLEIAGA